MTGREALAAMLRPRAMGRALIVALVVGSILNLINQGDALWHGEPIAWGKLCQTYFVPFVVATYGGWAALVRS